MLETSPEIVPQAALGGRATAVCVDRDPAVGVAAEAGPSILFQDDESLRRSPVPEDLVPERPLDRGAVRRVCDEQHRAGEQSVGFPEVASFPAMAFCL